MSVVLGFGDKQPWPQSPCWWPDPCWATGADSRCWLLPAEDLRPPIHYEDFRNTKSIKEKEEHSLSIGSHKGDP